MIDSRRPPRCDKGTSTGSVFYNLSWASLPMASWKTKGYVSDSEDDDEDIEAIIRRPARTDEAIDKGPTDSISRHAEPAEHQPVAGNSTVESPVEASPHGLSKTGTLSQQGNPVSEAPKAIALPTTSAITTTAKLEDSISRGLSLVREVLSRSASPRAPAVNVDDSPLSTPPDSPTLWPQPFELVTEPALSHAKPTSEPAGSLGQQAIETIAPRRTFRQRNAIQQHPYSLEWAVYAQHCAERGIRPVHMPRAPSPTRATKAVETQDTQFEDDSQNQESLEHESMELDDLDRINVHGTYMSSSQSEANAATDVAEDLPDLQDLLSKRPGQSRRRKRQHASTSAPMRPVLAEEQRIYEMTSDGEPETPLVLKPSRISAKQQQESFPSPPRSVSVDSAALQSSIGQSSPNPSPAALPTPIVSSGVRPRKRPVIEDDTQSGQENEPVHIASSTSESGSSDSEPDSPVNVQLMQKKVKGVLPASWWTVDRAQQVFDAKKKNGARSPNKPLHEVGVAQRKTTSTVGFGRPTPSNSMWYDDLISDDETADAVSNVSASTPLRADIEGLAPRESTTATDSEAMEIVDDDGIDPMLPTRSRTRKWGRAKQTNLRGYVQEHRSPRAQTSVARRVHQKIAEQHQSRKRPKQKASPDAVHVLDAPGLQVLEPQKRPRFLQVAARQARAQRNTHGISASRKFFQLDNEEDTMDMLGELRTWKANKAAKNHMSVAAQARGTSHQSTFQTTGAAAPGRAQSHIEQDHGQIVQCGLSETDQNELRLTRLRSLLPITNRSGHGQFAFRSAEPRNAQLEVVRHNCVGLRRRMPDMRTASSRPNIVLHESSAHVQSRDLNTEDLSTDEAVPPRKSFRRTRKQRPVYRPRLEQTRLVPPSPKPSLLEDLVGQTGPQVRFLLEKEFAEHQTAWFQGSKSGITVSNQKTQQHFQTFLDVLKSYLPVALQDAEDSREARELRSFLHRLIPNRGQIGAQGQIGDKVSAVLEYDILVAHNVFDLHTCLMNLAPGCAPRPRVLEMKVNFSDAHHAICSIALGAWETIYNCHHTDASIVAGLAAWIFSILSQLLMRWKAAETEARAEAGQAMRRIDERLIRKVIEHNRQQTCELLVRTLAALQGALKNATGLTEANALLDHIRYQEFLSTASQVPEMDDVVIEKALSLPIVYLEQQWHLQHLAAIARLLISIRQAMTNITSTRVLCSSDLRYTMIKVYFTLARAAVTQGQRSWDEFFDPRSSHSLDMFIAESYLPSMKTFFYHCLLSQEASHYELELRVVVLSHWLSVLLRARSDPMACCLLTVSLFRHEQDSLAMTSLAELFRPPKSATDNFSLQDRLPEVRHAVVMHVIQYLHGQEDNAEADWLVGGIDETDAIRMLRTIFTTMKETWMSLSEQPEEQDMYTVLVHSALNQYDLYPRTDFTIDPWFFNSATFPQRQKHTLTKLFTAQFETNKEFIKEVKQQLSYEITHATKYGRLMNLGDELKKVLLPTETDMVAGTIEQAGVLLRHAEFVDEVIPEILGTDGSHQADIKTMLLKVLVYLLENLECRIDALATSTMRPLIKAMLHVTSVVARIQAIAASEYEQLTFTFTRLTYGWIVTTLCDPPESFMSDVEAICDAAARAGGEEALMLLDAVMRGV